MMFDPELLPGASPVIVFSAVRTAFTLPDKITAQFDGVFKEAVLCFRHRLSPEFETLVWAFPIQYDQIARITECALHSRRYFLLPTFLPTLSSTLCGEPV